MSSTEKLAMFLNILAHHEKNRSIKVDYIRSGCSVIRAFNECLRAILKLTPVLLVKPNPMLEDDTDDRWKWFKGCLGALDGTYISIRVEAIYKSRYKTRPLQPKTFSKRYLAGVSSHSNVMFLGMTVFKALS
uniref:Transposase n=1 Tax=Solanum tuberosum TaxID=4113 RepID=M0ZMC4_SOLTU